MKRAKVLSTLVAATLTLSSSASFAGPAPVVPGKTFGIGATGFLWAVFGCSGGIILAASVANFQQNRQLTPTEAASCGLLFWIAPPRGPRR